MKLMLEEGETSSEHVRDPCTVNRDSAACGQATFGPFCL